MTLAVKVALNPNTTNQPFYPFISNPDFCWPLFANFLLNDKILDESKFIAFADDKIIFTQKLKFVMERVETLWEKD